MEKTSVIASGRYSTIDELLDSFHSAAATANLQKYFGCFAVNGRFLGTDAAENWSAQEFFDYAKPHFDRGTGWSYTPRKETRRVDVITSNSYSGRSSDRNDARAEPLFASFDELLDSASFLATSRGSGSLVFNAGTQTWLIFSYHLTFPIPNPLAMNMCKEIAAFESTQCLASQEAKAQAVEKELLASIDSEAAAGKNTGGKNKGKRGKTNNRK